MDFRQIITLPTKHTVPNYVKLTLSAGPNVSSYDNNIVFTVTDLF